MTHEEKKNKKKYLVYKKSGADSKKRTRQVETENL